MLRCQSRDGGLAIFWRHSGKSTREFRGTTRYLSRMASEHKAYYLRKKAFLESQLALIEQPFELPQHWLEDGHHAEGEDAVPPRHLHTAVQKMNAELRKQFLQSFSHQSTRQVLDQLQTAHTEAETKGIGNGQGVKVGKLDLMDTGLSRTLRSGRGLRRYAELRARVLSLQRSYLSVKGRHSYYQTLHSLLSKLDVQAVQQMVPSRDSAVVKELERTKTLDIKRFKTQAMSTTHSVNDQLQTIRNIAVGTLDLRNAPTSSVYDAKYMLEALAIAQEAYNSGEVPVGCVFVLDGEIVARGRNTPNETYNGTRHAEIEAIDQFYASDKYVTGDFRRCDLYVTVEPCVMCASALRQIRIRKVYFGCTNERFGGNGSVLDINNTDSALTTSTSTPYPSEGGFYREEAIMLLRKFYVRENNHAPTPKKKSNRVLKMEINPLASGSPSNGDTANES
ncbi:hypothetical protein BC937DRAFT_93002 [Endogone sp. FLAS-F59071]|nr:hypothetical protein BC937DRAFT_93002 [Endogone sp. FLAS-F59071]|eukprot:RUS23047.1 hypothetical protein BC937DRAFT_93002 [Endogone sp. FLAS-F59071]